MNTDIWLASMLNCDYSTTTAVVEQYILNRGYYNLARSGNSSSRADSIGIPPAPAHQPLAEFSATRHITLTAPVATIKDARGFSHAAAPIGSSNEGVSANISPVYDSPPVSRHSGDATKEVQDLQYYFRDDRFE